MNLIKTMWVFCIVIWSVVGTLVAMQGEIPVAEINIVALCFILLRKEE